MGDESALPTSVQTDYPGCAATPERSCADCNAARATAAHRLACRTKARAVEMAAASGLVTQTAAFVCTLPRCKNKKFAAAEDAAAHIGTKVANASKASGVPRVCVLDGCTDTVAPEGVVPTLECHYIHVERVHGVLGSTHKQTSASLAQGVTSFCLICRDFVFGRAAWDDHLRTHLDPLLALLRRDPASFAVLTSPNGTCTRPGLCPFCVYDETLTLNVRIQQFAEAKKLNRHIQQHLRDLAIADNETEEPGTHDCPHTSCRRKKRGRGLSLVQLGNHLIDVHGLWWLGVTTRLGEGKAKRTKQRIESAARWDGSLDALKSAEPRKSAGKGKGKGKAQEDAVGDAGDAGDEGGKGEGEGGAGPGPSTTAAARKRERKTDGEVEVDGDDMPAPAKKARSSSKGKGKGKAKATEAGDGAEAPAAAKKPRKTRSDAGKKRGPRKSKEAAPAVGAVGAALPAAGPSSSGVVAPSASSAQSASKSVPPAPPTASTAKSTTTSSSTAAARTSAAATVPALSRSSTNTSAASTSAAAASLTPAAAASSTRAAASSSAAPTTATAASPTSAERAYVNRKRRRVVSDSEDDV